MNADKHRSGSGAVLIRSYFGKLKDTVNATVRPTKFKKSVFIFLHLRSSVFTRLRTAVWLVASIGLASAAQGQQLPQSNQPIYAPPAAYGQFVNGDSLAP